MICVSFFISSSLKGSALFIEMSSFFSSFIFNMSLGIADTNSFICSINLSLRACLDCEKSPLRSTCAVIAATFCIVSALTRLCISSRRCSSLFEAFSTSVFASASPAAAMALLFISACSAAPCIICALRCSLSCFSRSISASSDFACSRALSASSSSLLTCRLRLTNILSIKFIFFATNTSAAARIRKFIILNSIST